MVPSRDSSSGISRVRDGNMSTAERHRQPQQLYRHGSRDPAAAAASDRSSVKLSPRLGGASLGRLISSSGDGVELTGASSERRNAAGKIALRPAYRRTTCCAAATPRPK